MVRYRQVTYGQIQKSDIWLDTDKLHMVRYRQGGRDGWNQTSYIWTDTDREGEIVRYRQVTYG